MQAKKSACAGLFLCPAMRTRTGPEKHRAAYAAPLPCHHSYSVSPHARLSCSSAAAVVTAASAAAVAIAKDKNDDQNDDPPPAVAKRVDAGRITGHNETS